MKQQKCVKTIYTWRVGPPPPPATVLIYSHLGLMFHLLFQELQVAIGDGLKMNSREIMKIHQSMHKLQDLTQREPQAYAWSEITLKSKSNFNHPWLKIIALQCECRWGMNSFY